MAGRNWGKWIIVGALAVALGVFFAFDLGSYLSLDALNANRARLLEMVASAPILSALGFALVYVTVTSISLPVATALTLLAGALFGRIGGTILVNVSATTGATIAFLATRYLFADWVQRTMVGDPGADGGPDSAKARRARSRRATWERAKAGIQESGFNYLLVLRLIPVVPFFLINLVAGVSPLPARSFILGTLVGTLPGTFLYVNAGTALGTLSKPSDLFSVRVLGALTLLALFSLLPVAWRRWRHA